MTVRQRGLRALSLTILLTSTAACRTTSEDSLVREGGGTPVGEFVGGPAIQQIVWENLLDQNELSSKTFRVSRILGSGVFQQRGLLGGNADEGDRFEFRGGVPNPLGVLLWYKTMRTFAGSFGKLCDQPVESRTLTFPRSFDAPIIRTDLNETLRRICNAPATTDDLTKLWRTVIGIGLDDEKAAFLAAFGPDTPDTFDTGSLRVESVMVALLMNPSLLLQQ